MPVPRWSLTEVLASRPRVRVNQVGYLPGRPAHATLVSDAVDPVAFAVIDAAGRRLQEGRSQPWPIVPEPTSGLRVHVLDLTGVTGEHLRVTADGAVSHPFPVTAAPYGRLARDALGVFRLLRSGTALGDDVPPGYARPAGHAGVPPNRGDTAVPAWTGPDAERLYPGWRCPGVFDVSGGWYDAGDYGKYVTSGAVAVWRVLSTLDLLAAGEDPTFAGALREEGRWQLDWLLRMQVPPGRPLAGMAFHRVHGTQWSPVPGWPHEDPTERVLHRPSTAATLRLAAAAAHGARAFAVADPAFAARLLGAARIAYDAADHHPVLLAPDDHARHGGGPYHDDDPADDRYWAAAELWLTTGQERYRDDVLTSPRHRSPAVELDGSEEVVTPARLGLAVHGGSFPGHEEVVVGLVEAADALLDVRAAQPWGQPYAPADGWDWGSNGIVLDHLAVLATAQRLTGERRFGDGVAGGIDHVLGRNALGQCYVTGHGTDDTRHQRTRQFGHDLDPDMPPPPPGALAGGPCSRPSPDFPYDERLLGLPPQLCYLDEPTSEVTNDVCIRWNAPLVHVSTYLHRSG